MARFIRIGWYVSAFRKIIRDQFYHPNYIILAITHFLSQGKCHIFFIIFGAENVTSSTRKMWWVWLKIDKSSIFWSVKVHTAFVPAFEDLDYQGLLIDKASIFVLVEVLDGRHLIINSLSMTRRHASYH